MVVTKTLLATGTAVSACAALGSVASREVRTSARAADALAGTEQTAYARALGANLVLNAGWRWVLFRAHRLGGAVTFATILSAAIRRRNRV